MQKKIWMILFLIGCLVQISVASAGNLNTQLNFDGDDDSIQIPNNAPMDLLGQPSFTWEAWIYPHSWGGGGYGRILEIFNINLDPMFWISSNGRLNAQWSYDLLASYAVSNDGYVDLNQWNHVVAVQENQNFTLYIDTVEPSYAQYQTGDGTHVSSGSEVWFFGNKYDESRGFDGLIDEFRFYNRTLSYAEIVYSFNNIEPQDQTGLVCWLRMNEGAGGITYDETAHNNDATLEPDYPANAPAWTTVSQTAQENLSDAFTASAQLIASFMSVMMLIHVLWIMRGENPEWKTIVMTVLAYLVLAIILLAFASAVLNL